MRIYVKLYATLRQYIPHSATVTDKEGLDVAEGTTIAEVMEMLGLPEHLKVLSLLNGVHCREKEKSLKDGDTLLFYPLMAGG